MLTPEQIETAARNVCKALGLDPAQHLAEQIEIMRHFDVASIERDRALQGVVEPEDGSVYYEQDGLKWLLVQGNPPQFVRVEAEEPEEPDEEEPMGDILFEDRFTELSLEDGMKGPTGKRWADCFHRWKVRRLADAPNLDQGEKIHVPGKTHIITPEGLSLRAYADKASPTGYYAGMIQGRSFSFGPGSRLDIDARLANVPPGTHLSFWLMPKSGAGLPEFDALEVVGSNSWAKNGPINSVFFNAKTEGEGHWHQHDVPDGFFKQKHRYSLVWKKTGLEWLIDGQKLHSAPNLYDGEMEILITWELGASANGDFPGPINAASVWPAEVVLSLVRVTRV